MKLHPRVTRTAVELVKRFEGLRRRAARLPDGSWTIGYGHTLTAREGAVVTPEDAEALLYYDLSEVATKLEAWTFTTLNQNQFDALTAFAFNIGLENFRRSTVLKRVNEGQQLQAAAAMELWRKTEFDGEGLVVDALVRRRAAEKALFLTPPEGFRPSPSQVLRPAFDFSVIEAAAQSHAAQRAAVIDAPMEGDEAIATLESSAGHLAETTSPPQVRDADDLAAHGLQDVALAATVPFLAERVVSPVLHAPDSAPANDASVLELPASAASEAAPFGFRGFEPPPARFPSAASPSDQVLTVPPAEPEGLVHEPVQAEAAPEFNLFDRPLAPPQPPEPTASAEKVRSMRLRDDDDHLAAAEPGPEDQSPALSRSVGGLLQNRAVLFGSIGFLGVVLFTLAISTMMMGKATLAHLAIGFLGVALITPAGVYFLMRRSGEGAEPLSDHSNAEYLSDQ